MSNSIYGPDWAARERRRHRHSHAPPPAREPYRVPLGTWFFGVLVTPAQLLQYARTQGLRDVFGRALTEENCGPAVQHDLVRRVSLRLTLEAASHGGRDVKILALCTNNSTCTLYSKEEDTVVSTLLDAGFGPSYGWYPAYPQ